MPKYEWALTEAELGAVGRTPVGIALTPFNPDHSKSFLFSLRMIKYFLCWMVLWQGRMVGGSIFQLTEWGIDLPGLMTSEIVAATLALVVLFERSVTRDFSIRRSYFNGPMLLIVVAFFISWLRGCYLTQRFAPVLEAHEAFSWPFSFWLICNAFRDREDREVLWKLLLLSAITKSVEGVDIYFFSGDPKKSWGVVQMWRDGTLLGLGAIAVMLLLQYRGTALATMKKIMLWAIPVLGFTFVMSYRRTFFVSTLACACAMLFTLPREKRRRHIAIVGGFLAVLVGFTMVTNPLAVLGRLTGIIEPSGEGSAYIRLMEIPNVLQNIAHHPFFGVPVGTTWKTYYRMPISAVYTTLGTHDTYLYWPLRAGILGTVAFFWLLGRMWKTALVNYALRTSEEDFFFGQLSIQIIILFQVACFFGLLYGDAMSTLMAVIITAMQLQAKHVSGRSSYKDVDLWKTVRSRELVFKERVLRQIPVRSLAAI
jgi:O-antigen ligase